jgi:hypothetical protein
VCVCVCVWLRCRIVKSPLSSMCVCVLDGWVSGRGASLWVMHRAHPVLVVSHSIFDDLLTIWHASWAHRLSCCCLMWVVAAHPSLSRIHPSFHTHTPPPLPSTSALHSPLRPRAEPSSPHPASVLALEVHRVHMCCARLCTRARLRVVCHASHPSLAIFLC